MLDGKIGEIREKGSNLVLCTRYKESEETLLRVKQVCVGGLCVAIELWLKMEIWTSDTIGSR